MAAHEGGGRKVTRVKKLRGWLHRPGIRAPGWSVFTVIQRPEPLWETSGRSLWPNHHGRASNLEAMASNLIAMASNPNSDSNLEGMASNL